MDAARYGRIWELSIRGARSPEVAGLTAVVTANHDGVELRRYDRAPVEVLADVRELLPTARQDGPVSARLELAEVGFAPHRCIQITPAVGKPTRLTFPGLTLGSELVGYAGLADVFTRRDIRSPGKLEVEIAGKVVATVEPGVDDGWVRFAVATAPGPTDVTFIASATKPNRLVCFAAEARR
jgi:hypothetical protein